MLRKCNIKQCNVHIYDSITYNAIFVPCNWKTKYCADFTEVYKERLTIEQYIPDVFVKSSYCKYLKRNKIRIWHVKYELWNCELAGAAGQLGIQLTRQTPHLPQYTASGEDEDEAWPDHFQAAKFAWLAMCELSPWRRPQWQCGRDVSLCCLSLQQLLSPQSAANILLTGSGRCLVTDSLQSLVIIVITFQTDITHFTSPHCSIFPGGGWGKTRASWHQRSSMIWGPTPTSQTRRFKNGTRASGETVPVGNSLSQNLRPGSNKKC